MFVNFEDQKEIAVNKTYLSFFQMQPEDEEKEICPSFVQQIREYTGQSIVDILTPNFTTTTAISFAVGQLSIMAAMKNYFNHRILLGGCGFPYVIIEGSLEDWTKIIAK